jgi:hypothetical protein
VSRVKIDWEQAEKTFVSGDMTGAELAGQMRVQPATVSRHRTAGDWDRKRMEYHRARLKRAQSETRKVRAGNVAEIIEKVHDLRVLTSKAYVKALRAGEIKPSARDIVALAELEWKLGGGSVNVDLTVKGSDGLMGLMAKVVDWKPSEEVQNAWRKRAGLLEPGKN